MASAQEGLQIQIGNSPVASAVVDYINNTNVESINQQINSVRNGATLFTEALSNVITNYSKAVTNLVSRAGSNIFNAKAQLGSLGSTIFVKIKYSDTAQQIGEAVRGEMSVETLRKILLERFERVLLDVARNKTSDPNLQPDALGDMIKRGQKIGGGDRLLLDLLVADPKIREPISYMGENYATKVKGKSPMLHAASREKYAAASKELTQMAKDMTEHTAWELKSDEIASELRDLDDVRNKLEDDAYIEHIIKSILDNLINRKDGDDTIDDQMWAGPDLGTAFLREKVIQVLDVVSRKIAGIYNKELFYVPAIFATWNIQKAQFDIYFNDIRARTLAVQRFLDIEMDNFNGIDFNQFPELQLVGDASKAATINRIKQDARLFELQELANKISGDVINIDKWTIIADGSLKYDGRDVEASAETNIVSHVMSLISRARQILQSGQAGQIAGRLLTLENGLVNFTLDFNPRTIIPGNFILTEPIDPMPPRQITQGIDTRKKTITALTKYNREISITRANELLDQAKVKDQTRVQKAAAAGRGLSMLAAAAAELPGAGAAVPVWTTDMTTFDQTPAQAAEETARIRAMRQARDNRGAAREEREEDEPSNRAARDAAGGKRRQYRKTRKMKGGRRRTGARKTARRVRRGRTMKRKANRRTGRQRKTRR
jgi:hypothetical protein